MRVQQTVPERIVQGVAGRRGQERLPRLRRMRLVALEIASRKCAICAQLRYRPEVHDAIRPEGPRLLQNQPIIRILVYVEARRA